MINKLPNIKIFFLTAGIIISFFYLAQNTKAEDESITELTEEQQEELEETQDKIKELEEKAKTYQEIIDIKQKQQMTLNNQVSIIETEAERLKAEIEFNKGKIEELNSQISDLERQISEKEGIISAQKKILTQLIQKYYEYNEEELFSILFNGGGLISFTSGEDQVAQAGDKIREVLDNVESLKNKLEQEKKSAEEKKEEINNLFQEQKEKNSELQDNIDQKEALISQTRGEESRYQQLLAKVEQQKAELLNIDELGVNLSANDYEKPSSKYYASTTWYYSQWDSRWGDKIIAGDAKVKQYGCALTSVAMILKYYGLNVTPKSVLTKASFTNSALIFWPLNWDNIYLIGGINGYNHHVLNSSDWRKIDDYLKNNRPIIVYIAKSNSNGGHYVVIHTKTNDGKYVVHDPYWGSNIYLDTSKSLVGKLSPAGSVYIDQMIVYRK